MVGGECLTGTGRFARRIGDRRALPALRRALSSEYALLRSRSARSLANLGDQEAVPLLLARFRTEPQDRVCVAYAAALGVFRVREALDGLLGLLERLDLDTLRGEAALAVARLLGGEQYYVRLWRAARSDPGTALAEAVRRLRRRRELDPAVAAELSAAEQAFARHDLGSGSAALARAIGRRPPGPLGAAPQAVLAACGRWLAGAGPARVDNLLLAMLGLHAAGLGGRRQDAAGEPNPAAAEKESDGDRNANASGKE